MIKYAEINNYKIVGLRRDSKLYCFIVTDRNEQRVNDKVFDLASEDITWADEHYSELVK